jgi:ABC-type dipeptide/oligopeptide/nickel transport system permease subunit
MSAAAPLLHGGPVAAATAPSTRFETLHRLLTRPTAVLSAAVLVLLALSAVLAPLIQRHSPTALDPVNQLQGPSGAHWFGTDELGRDLYSRMVNGGRLALTIAATATALAMIVGTLWGGIAALLGGLVDEVLMRVVDGIMAIPVILVALILVAAFGASATSLPIILGVLHAPATARMARSAVLIELNTEYCAAASASGASWWRMLRREILPNATPTLLVQASVNAASVILTEAALSFVGLGIQPPRATWGTLVNQGYAQIFNSYWFVTFPSVAIFITIWALNVFADQLQAVLDPHGAHR